MSPKRKRHDNLGFSLVELVVALGICAIGLVALVGLLATAARQAGAAAESATAQRVFAAVQAEVARGGVDAVLAALANAGDPVDESEGVFANRAGTVIGDAARIPAEDRFFAILLERNPDLSPPASDAVSGYLAFQVRIEWPYRLPNGTYVAAPNRSVRRYPAAHAR